MSKHPNYEDELKRLEELLWKGYPGPQVTCSKCAQNRTRIYKYTAPSGQRKYVDEHGRKWNGKECPQCRKQAHTKYMRTWRTHKAEEVRADHENLANQDVDKKN